MNETPKAGFSPATVREVSFADIENFKTQVNDSFAEVANLYLDLVRRMDLLEERIEKHNTRSSHKI